ncbi:MAG TPA: PTS fructose transporter subunit IIA [Thermoanaerobaculia bacterium]|nr:PTS fructose transporter subunit IIA [Thermoanaerobaculia bacterium]
MVQILVLTHGTLAQALLETARTISGELPNLQALALDWNEPRDRLREELAAHIAALDQGQGVLVLTDLFGDTPSNLALSLIDPGRVQVVTGVNLPMVLRLSCLGERAMSLEVLARWIQQKGQQGIRLGSRAAEAVGERR